MAAIKRTPADQAFSKCIRERANWTCESCGTVHVPDSKGLECSHHHSRGNWSIRFDPLNAEALCTACHFRVGGTEERRAEVLTEAQRAILYERKESRSLGKEYRRTKGKGDVAKHYRNEHKRMQEARDNGHCGRLEFIGWI